MPSPQELTHQANVSATLTVVRAFALANGFTEDPDASDEPGEVIYTRLGPPVHPYDGDIAFDTVDGIGFLPATGQVRCITYDDATLELDPGAYAYTPERASEVLAALFAR